MFTLLKDLNVKIDFKMSECVFQTFLQTGKEKGVSLSMDQPLKVNPTCIIFVLFFLEKELKKIHSVNVKQVINFLYNGPFFVR